jgi:hypothetical protein
MLRVYAHRYIALGESLHDCRALFYGATDKEIAEAETQNDIKEMLTALLHQCKALDLSISQELVSQRIINLPESLGEYDCLIDAVRAELKTKLFIFVPPHRSKFYDSEDFLSDKIKQAFPGASKEIDSGCQCYAVGQYTAAVFHSMRAVEIGLRALAIALNVTFAFPLEQAEWAVILDQIEPKITEMKQRQKSAEKSNDLKFYSEAGMNFRYFKDGWRVHVAHAREKYDERQALEIITHCQSFFSTLAERLKEPS